MATRGHRNAPLAAFVLHHYDWSESSLILDLFTREQGRIAVAAKGAKRPFSQLRSVLLPFQRIQVSLGRQAVGEDARDVQNRRGALQRLLPQRAADEARRPSRRPSGAVRRLRGNRRIARRRGAQRREQRTGAAARLRARVAEG